MPVGLGLSLSIVLLAALQMVIRVAPIWRHRHQGCDAYFYLLCAEDFRARRRLPIVLPPYYLLEPQEQAYPPLTSMMLGILPESWVARFYWAIAPAIDMFSLALLVAWVGAAFGIGYAWLVGLAYAANASTVLEFGSLTSRPLALLETNVFLLTSWIWTQGSIGALVAAVLSGALLLYTHKLSVQLLWFLVPFLAIALVDWRWILPIAFAYAGAFLVAPRLFVEIVRAHWDIVAFWHRNWPFLNTHIVRQSPLYARKDSGTNFYRRHDSVWLTRQIRMFLNYNSFILFAPMLAFAWPRLLPMERFALLWVAGTYLWALATYFLRPLRCLGEGNKYLKYAFLPSLYIAGASMVELPRAWTTPIVIICIGWTIYAYWQTAVRLAGPLPTTGRMAPALEILVDRLKSLADARVLCLPVHLADMVAFYARRPVLWGTHGLGFERAEPFFPVLRRPIEEFVREYKLTYLLLDETYVGLDELHLSGTQMIAQSGKFQLIAL